jgi:hypothetical protein
MTNAPRLDNKSGTARLPVVVPVAMLSFFYAAILEYALPLYFGALGEAARAQGGTYPADIWSELVKYQQTPWIIGPLLAGLLARRYGERIVWSGAQLGMVVIPVMLAIHPQPTAIKIVALWYGLTGALMWIGGVSLAQMVPAGKKGLSNALMMTSIGVGSMLGPLASRAMLYRQELGIPLIEGDWSGLVLKKLLTLAPTASRPQVADFLPIFWLLAGSTLVCSVALGLWGQRPGRFEHDQEPDWRRTISDLRQLVANPRFWALVLALCVFGGPIFVACNQFLPYRAEEVGLKSGAADQGWIWLQLLRTLMWIPGGLAVGLLAGRRAPGVAAVAMLGSFAVAALGVGESHIAWQLFCCMAAYEFVRSFMRWSHAGYLSEHMPEHLRATAIGCSITCAGTAGTIFSWLASFLWNPNAADFRSSSPFVVAAVIGLIGCAGLYVFDRFYPIRERRAAMPTASASLLSAEADVSAPLN